MSNINIWIGQLTANACHASIEDFQEILGLLEDEEHGDKKEAIAIVKDIIRKVNTQSEAQALQQQLQDQLQIEESDEEDDGMVERHLLDNALAKIEEQRKFVNDGSKRFKHFNDVYLRLSDNLNARIEVLEKSLEEQVSVTKSMEESNANLHRDNHQLKQELSKLQKEFDELCKEYDALCKSEGGDIDKDGRASKRLRSGVTSSSTGEKEGEKDNMEEGEKDDMEEGEKDGEKDDEMSDVSKIKEVDKDEDSSAIVESGKGGMDIDKDKPSEEEEAKDSEEEAAGGAVVGDTEDREGRTSTPRTRRGTSSLSKDTEENKLMNTPSMIVSPSIILLQPHVEKPSHSNILVLNKVSFTLNDGQILGITAPSGSGKSSIINLIMRFYEPTLGKIILDGTDIKEMMKIGFTHRLLLSDKSHFSFMLVFMKM